MCEACESYALASTRKGDIHQPAKKHVFLARDSCTDKPHTGTYMATWAGTKLVRMQWWKCPMISHHTQPSLSEPINKEGRNYNKAWNRLGLLNEQSHLTRLVTGDQCVEGPAIVKDMAIDRRNGSRLLCCSGLSQWYWISLAQWILFSLLIQIAEFCTASIDKTCLVS